MPSGYHYISSEYGASVDAAITNTGGLNLTYGSDTEVKIYEHIVDNIAPPHIEFNVILPTGWKDISLVDVISPDNYAKSDSDDFTDWEEIDTESGLITWDNNGNIQLPTFKKCLEVAADRGYNVINEYNNTVPSYMRSYFYNEEILPIHSNPCDEDSDGDGYIDSVDLYPFKFVSYYEDFSVINDFNYTPDEVNMTELREESDTLYGSYVTTGVGFTYAKANLIALGGQTAMITHTASDMLYHYLENTGETYSLNVKEMISTSSISKKRYNELVDNARKYAYDALNEGESIILMSKTVKAHEYESILDVNWNASVGQCSGILICQAEKIENEIKMTTRYIVYDFYDWEKGSTAAFIPTVSDGEMYTLHESGYAKQFYVYGEYVEDAG